MRLEVVDPKNQGLVRPAVVRDVEGHRLCVLFEGWPAVYAFWIEDDDPNLHPTNWARHTKHQLEHHRQKPKTGVSCPVLTKYCRNIGNALYKSRSGHKLIEECPYLPKNWMAFELSDRLDFKKKMRVVSQKCTEVVSKVVTPQKSLPTQKTTTSNSVMRHVKKLPIKTPPAPPPPHAAKTNGDVDKSDILALNNDEDDLDRLLETTTIITHPLKIDEQVKLGSELLQINSTTLPHTETPPLDWNSTQVGSYIKSIPACEQLGTLFETQEIDGTALLSLTKDDLMSQLKIKFGPAIKIYNCILKLREEILTGMVN